MTRRLSLALAIVLAAAILAPASAHASEGASTLADYRRRVDMAYAIATERLGDAWREELASQQAAAEINTLLPGTERVAVGTRTIDVDNSVTRSLIARLDASKSAQVRRDTSADILAHLGSLKAAVDAADGPARHDEALLARLLARSDLSSRPTLSDEFAKLIERLTRWLQEWFARIMRRRGVTTASDIGVGVVIVALCALLVFAVAQVVRSLTASLARHDERILAERAADDAAVVSAAEGLPPDALAYADELAAAGRFREAVRALFGGAARTLVDLGLLRSTRTRTNAELLGDLAPAAPPVLPPMTELSDGFERAWYGHADPGQEGFAEARTRYLESMRGAERAKTEAEADPEVRS